MCTNVFDTDFQKGIEANNIPMYMAELSPASIRGSMVNFYQWWLFIGAIIAKVVVFKSSVAWPNSEWAWRTGTQFLPVQLQFFNIVCSLGCSASSPSDIGRGYAISPGIASLPNQEGTY
jgi:hypothetical protein